MKKAYAANALSRTPARKKERIAEIDFLRGLAIFLMVLDHLCYDLSYWGDALIYIGGGNLSETIDAIAPVVKLARAIETSAWRAGLHIVFVGVFMLLSGISLTLSRDYRKRSLQITLLGYSLTLLMSGIAAYSGDATMNIAMGILNVMAIAHLLYCLKQFFFKGYKSDLYFFGVFLVLTIALVDPTPRVLGTGSNFVRNYFYLITGQAIGGLDYIRPLPCISLLFLGALLGKTLYAKKKSYLPFLRHAQPIAFMGSHTLFIYVLHQFVLVFILAIASLALGFVPNL